MSSTPNTLAAAAQAVLDRWDSPAWSWAPDSHTADLMHALRAALAAHAAPRALSDDEIRAVFLAAGFTVKEGQTDLKPYVYAAARALLAAAATCGPAAAVCGAPPDTCGAATHIAGADAAAGAPAQKLDAIDRRRIADAIRSAYDVGYNNARQARTIPGDSAPGYNGRDIESDHSGALIREIEARAMREAAGAPGVDKVAWWTLVMGAAASLDDAAACLRDPDALRAAEHAARHYHEQAAALYNATPQAAAGAPATVPAGWALAPMEPTVGMCIAGDEARMNADDATRTPAVYRAMLAAAPGAPATVPTESPALRAALEIRTASGWSIGAGPIPVLYTDEINGQQVMRDDVWLCRTEHLKAPATVQPLTDEQVRDIVRDASAGSAIRRDGSTSERIVRAVESDRAAAWGLTLAEPAAKEGAKK